jgi:hypothetical protein
VAFFSFIRLFIHGSHPTTEKFDFLDQVVRWVVPAIILGVIFLVLLPFAIYNRMSAIRYISYALTSRQAIAVDRRRCRLVGRVALDSVDQLDHEARSDGSGFIVFDYDMKYPKDDVLGYHGVAVPRLVFEDIDDVESVARLATKAIETLYLEPQGPTI